MRFRAEAAVRGWWDGEAGAAGRFAELGALPLEAAYRSAVAARNWAFDRSLAPTYRAAVPVVSVGNLAVGGTGKTPVAAWVVGALQEQGHRPAVAARGYGEDELLLHRRWRPDVAVYADRDRVRAADAAAREGADCVVLDDGFQHRRLARDLDLVLLAAEHRFPGPLLPRGRYREPASSLARAHVVILTSRTAEPDRVDALAGYLARVAPRLSVARVRLVRRSWQRLDGGAAASPRGDVLAVCAVAGPEAFRRMVAASAGGRVDCLSFPDHHDYRPADVEAIVRRAAGRAVAVTEKDAVKLHAWADVLEDVRVLALAVQVEAGEGLLRERLREAAGR